MTRYVLAGLLFLPSSIHAQSPGRAKAAHTDHAAASASTAATEIWKIDTAHSELAFGLRLFAGRARGQFNVWSGTITLPSGNWNAAVVNVVIQAASIDTKNTRRDDHLRNEDFFDAEKYPTITFKSTNAKRHGDSVIVAGNLTMKNVTKPIVLKGKFLGTEPGPTPRMSFQATTTINRLDYGVNYDAILMRDKIVLGEDVTIDIRLGVVR